jgi:hypothetical protein
MAHKHEEAGTLGTASLLLIGQTRPSVFYLDAGLFLPYSIYQRQPRKIAPNRLVERTRSATVLRAFKVEEWNNEGWNHAVRLHATNRRAVSSPGQ